MKPGVYLFLLLFFLAGICRAQESFLGIQNSQRKGMINALMNPAELNHLNKKVEVSFFALGETLDNNVLSFQDMLSDFNQFESIFERISEPVNVRTDLTLMGPSVGIRLNKWSIGFTSQVRAKVDVIDFNPKLGDAIINETKAGGASQTQLDLPYNQRINAVGWLELGLMAGTSIWETKNQSLSLGGHFKVLFPGTYANLGVDQIQATLLTDQDRIRLSNARGILNLSYDERWDINRTGGLGFDTDLWTGFSPRGFAVDLGANYLLKRNGRRFLNLGMSLKNLGAMTTASSQVTRNYQINIAPTESFRIDNLEGSIEEIEQQLVASGFFTASREETATRIHLPQQIAAYVEFSPVRNFQVSVYGQKRIEDESRNRQLSSPDLLVVTPRFIAGKLEIYSPWMQHQVSGLAGGFGIQFGGFFVGSQSVITGLLADSSRLDVHAGLSWGF